MLNSDFSNSVLFQIEKDEIKFTFLTMLLLIMAKLTYYSIICTKHSMPEEIPWSLVV